MSLELIKSLDRNTKALNLNSARRDSWLAGFWIGLSTGTLAMALVNLLFHVFN